MTSNMPHKDATNVPRELSPHVWGQIPVRACADLIGGNGRVASPIDIQQAAAGVIRAGGDVIGGDADATTAVSVVDRGQRITPATNKGIAFGFTNCNCDFTNSRRWGYEVCIAFADAGATHGFAAGLTSRASAGVSAYTANAVFSAGELVTTNVSFVGFRKDEVDEDIDILYKTDGSAIPTTAATGLHTTGAATLTDGNFFKLGMQSNGSVIRFYVDNVQIGVPVDLSDAYLPAEADLIPVFMLYSNGVTTFDISWMAFAEAN